MLSNQELLATGGTTGSIGADITGRNITTGLNPEDDIGNLPGSLTNFVGGITGRNIADAIREGALSQVELGELGLQATADAQRRLEETLAPFVGVGTGRLEQAINLFGPGAAQRVTQDPAFQAAAERAQTQLLAQQAARGRLGTAETAGGLSSALSNLGSDFLSRQRGDLLGAIQLGQASAAQQGASGLATGSRQAELQTQLGNILAASGVGQANALAQGSQNAAGLIGTVASIFSDRRLKRNISKYGKHKNYNTYRYQYLWSDTWFIGVMSDEVDPKVVSRVNGFDIVDYGAL
jgi:hypothetical protein